MAASIRSMGILQPLVVRPIGDGRYQIIAGERRWRAARRAGLTTVPCIVRSMDDQTVLAAAMVENLQRRDLNPIEAARGYRRLQDQFGLTQDQIAELVGKSRVAISNTLRLLSLPEEVQQMISDGRLSEGHGRALLGLSDTPGVLVSLAHRAAEEGLSVRDVELAVRQYSAREEQPVRASKTPDLPEPYRAAQAALQEALATSVRVRRRRGGRGTIEIDFYGDEDLERLVELICGPEGVWKTG